MTLNEFLNKWSADAESEYQQRRERNKLLSAIATFFDRDPRTVRNWSVNTPRYAEWLLQRVSQEWEQTGKTYSVFFDS